MRADSALMTMPRASSIVSTSPYRKSEAPSRESHEQFGPYLIYEQLGEGGMARVHRAELQCAAGVRKTVALKRMHTTLSLDASFVDAFVREAQIASRLRHPHIAQAFELGKINGTYYIAMELVPGPTLAQIMRQSRDAAGAIPLPIVIEILIQLCDALEAVHELRDERGKPLQVIHRDISPANVVVSRTGAAKLIDFGIAKHRKARMETQVGVIKGKHAYLAPEYTYGRLDHRADLFALGIVAHEMLTGRRLFLAETEIDSIRAVRERHIHPPSRFNAAVPRDLDAIIMTALARDPEQRWQNAGAMRAALVTLVREHGAAVKGRQIRDWIEWAFEQHTRGETQIRAVLEHLEPSISLHIDDIEEVNGVPRRVRAAGSGPAAQRQAPTVMGKRTPVSAHRTTPEKGDGPLFGAMSVHGTNPDKKNGARPHFAGGTGRTPKIDPEVLLRAQEMARLSAPAVGKSLLRAHQVAPLPRATTQLIRERPRGLAVLVALVALTLQFDWLDLARFVDLMR